MMKKLSEISGIPLSQESGLGALTLAALVHEIGQQHASRDALVWTDLAGVRRSWTYAELLEESLKVARALLAEGVGKDTRVGILVSNRPEWLFSMFGAAMAGATTVALNTFSTPNELQYQLKIADVQLMIMEAQVASNDFVKHIFTICPALSETAPGELQMEDMPFLRRVVCIDKGFARGGLQDWDEFLEAGHKIAAPIAEATSASIAPIDRALIFFSSGSTGLPKAIQQTHRAATLQCWRIGKLLELDSSVRTWNANGYFFSGNFALAFSTLTVGGCLVLQRYFEPEKALELIQSEKVSYVISWPHQEGRLQECAGWNNADFSALRWVNELSAFRSHPTVNVAWEGYNAYGMTETFTLVAAVAGKDMAKGSHGTVFPGNVIRIVDPETGAILPLGETGEIIVKGPTLMLGYLKVPPEETFDKEGFIHTADAGYFSEDGHLYWKGRLGDIIKTGGANVSPNEIDEVLFEHPAIENSCTVGVPHESLGEIVVSCIVLREDYKLDEETVRAYAKQFLSSYKVPRKVLFFAESELPKTGSNKINRADLRRLASSRLQQTEK